MCGIAGFQLSDEERAERRLNARALTNRLLRSIEHRGRDATGVAWPTNNQQYVVVQKAPVPASSFTPRNSMWKGANSVIAHTRASTVGDPSINVNNHPIRTGPVVGIHNGVVSNDWSIFKKLKDVGVERIGRVDSEAIFASLAHGHLTPDGESDPIIGNEVTKQLEAISAGAAIAWYDEREGLDTLNLARLDSYPLRLVMTKAGSLFFASTFEALYDVASQWDLPLEWEYDVPEGLFLQVRGGRIITEQTFDPQPYQYTGYYSGWSSQSLASRTGLDSTSTSGTKELALPAGVTATTALPDPSKLGKDAFMDLTNKVADLAALIPGGTDELLDEDEHELTYWNRTSEVDDLLFEYDRILQEDPTEWWTVKDSILDQHLFLRQGDPVVTELAGDKVYGTCHSMPDALTGAYVLRVWVTNKAREGDFENIFIVRTEDEFTHFPRSEEKEWMEKRAFVDADFAPNTEEVFA